MLLKINGLPVYDHQQSPSITMEDIYQYAYHLRNMPGCGSSNPIVTEMCNKDAMFQYFMSKHPASNAVYDYVASLSEDIGRPIATVSKFATVGLWNDLNSMGEVVYEHWFPSLINSVAEIINR